MNVLCVRVENRKYRTPFIYFADGTTLLGMCRTYLGISSWIQTLEKIVSKGIFSAIYVQFQHVMYSEASNCVEYIRGQFPTQQVGFHHQVYFDNTVTWTVSSDFIYDVYL